ncbi:MAG TPA: PAS domain-containing sensor histidine kinase [Ktedonobacterales bacterium]|nr:PAS domain-containing sensor histidine kinase [Ktedonobacterales bacterium]
MIAQTRLSLPAPDGNNSLPPADLLREPAARQALDNLLAVQMQLELATGVPVAAYGPVGQPLPGISPGRPRLAEQHTSLPKDVLAPTDWPQQNGQMLEVVSGRNIHYFITPFIMYGAPIAQIILGPIQLFEPGAASAAEGVAAPGNALSIDGVPVLASWKAQAAAEIARTLVSKLSQIADDNPSHLPSSGHFLPVADQETTALTTLGNAPHQQQGAALQLGALAHDALLPEKTTAERSQKAIKSIDMLHTSPEDQETTPTWPAPAHSLQASDSETESLRGPVRMLRHLIETMPQAVIICAPPDGQIVLANRAARALWPEWLGSTGAEGQTSGPLHYRVTADDYPPEWLGLRVALRQAVSFRGEVSVESSEGEAPRQRPMLLNAWPLQATRGSASYAIAIFEDLSGLVERELFKDELLLLAAHDIRNPLTLISSHAQLLERNLARELPQGQSWERAHSRLSVIQEQVQQLTDLTNQLSTVTRLQSAQQRPSSETVNLAYLIQHAALDQRMITAERTIEIEVERDPCQVQGDQTQLHLILMSLLKNAVRYSHPSKPISVSLRCTSASSPLWAEVSVRDQGIGIPRASLPHIFKRFYRVGGSEQRARAAGIHVSSEQDANLGLSLYLCKQLLERMGGRIWIESLEGQGTTVCFTLPLKR